MSTTDAEADTAGFDYDPYDRVIDANPHRVWRRLRDEAPLYHNAAYDFYALSRFDDVLAASTDWRTYSSARGTVLEMIDTSPEGAAMFGGDGGGMMIFMDPPRHDDLRRLVSRAFTPRRVAALDARIRELCGDFLDPQIGAGGFDFLEDFGAKIPAMVIGALLGVPNEDQDQLRIWGDWLMRYEPDGISAEKAEAMGLLHEYLAAMVRDREQNPRDDMVSDLVNSEITLDDGTVRRLTRSEVHSFFTLLQLAGSETTARLLGWGAVLLARHPEQRAKLVADPTLVNNAVEELLRYLTIVHFGTTRTALEDVELDGQLIKAGDPVAISLPAANRDPMRFVDGDRLALNGTSSGHVAFGHGIHQCLGQQLARIEMRIGFSTLLREFPTLELAIPADEVPMRDDMAIYGVHKLPVAW
jgi:cytochrome P450